VGTLASSADGPNLSLTGRGLFDRHRSPLKAATSNQSACRLKHGRLALRHCSLFVPPRKWKDNVVNGGGLLRTSGWWSPALQRAIRWARPCQRAGEKKKTKEWAHSARLFSPQKWSERVVTARWLRRPRVGRLNENSRCVPPVFRLHSPVRTAVFSQPTVAASCFWFFCFYPGRK